MYSRVVSLVVSLMLLLTSVMASAPAIAAPDQHPQSVAALAALAPAAGELPTDDSASPDPGDRLLDIPDQLEGPRAPHDAPPRAFRMEPQVAVSLTQPHLKGPQRPPRATGLAA